MCELSDAVLEFLEQHPGESFTAFELWKHVSWPGRVFPAHVQQALERRLFLEGLVLAEGEIQQQGEYLRASPDTRWYALRGAPPGLLMYMPGEGPCLFEAWMD